MDIEVFERKDFMANPRIKKKKKLRRPAAKKPKFLELNYIRLALEQMFFSDANYRDALPLENEKA